MTVGELKELLDDYEDHQEVKFMGQPNWPFEFSISHMKSRADINRGKQEEDEDNEIEDDEDNDDLFLVEGEQLCYGSKNAWSV